MTRAVLTGLYRRCIRGCSQIRPSMCCHHCGWLKSLTLHHAFGWEGCFMMHLVGVRGEQDLRIVPLSPLGHPQKHCAGQMTSFHILLRTLNPKSELVGCRPELLPFMLQTPNPYPEQVSTLYASSKQMGCRVTKHLKKQTATEWRPRLSPCRQCKAHSAPDPSSHSVCKRTQRDAFNLSKASH